MAHYKPYVNMLTFTELEWLRGKHDAAAGEDRKMLGRILRKYGPDKLKLQPD